MKKQQLKRRNPVAKAMAEGQLRRGAGFHQSKKEYDRNREKRDWKQQVKER